MATLRDIRKRIRSVENIKQITRAMEMVAAARLRKAQAKAEQCQPYARKLRQILENLASASVDFTHPLYQQREVKRTGLVVIAADRGLCGSYNSNIFQAADRFIRSRPSGQTELILIGRKGVDYYRRRKRTPLDQVREWGGKISFDEIVSLGNKLTDWFRSGRLDEVWLCYTHFISIASRKVVLEKFLNIERPSAQKQPMTSDYIFEPNPMQIYSEILPRYCVIKIQTILDEAYAAELAARMISMGAATKNAEEMIDNLTLVRNKVRQAAITKEMLEITSGAEALK
jgi:F-type H+-transporting ATPase subunit gamma